VEKITGYSREQLLGQSGLDYMFPGFKGDALGMLQKVIARGGMQKEVVVPMKTATGKIIEVEATSSALRDGSGNPVGMIGTIRDISGRKRMEDALRDSEEKLRMMFLSMADGVVVTDLEGKIIDLNTAQLRMFGYKDKSELVGKGGFDFIVVRERGRALADMFSVYEKGFNTGATYVVVNRNGREFECELSTAMLHDAAGKPSGTITVMRDVTERKRIEESIRESEERYRLLAENVSDVIWTMDMNLKYTYVSPSVFNLRGFTVEEAVKMSVEETLAPESLKKTMQAFREELEVDHSDRHAFITLELELICKNGSTIWTEMKISFLYDSDGNRIGFMGITRDITERRKVEEALRDANEKLQVIFDSIGEAVTVVDLDANIVDANKEALRLHGFNSRDEIIGRKSSELVAIMDRERAVTDAVKSLNPPYLSGRSEYKLLDTSGREFDGEFNVAVLRDDMGKPAGFIGIARDISERKRMEEVLKKSEEYFKEITENSSDMIIITDNNGGIKYCSPSVERFAGYTPEDLIGKSAFRFIHPDDVQRAVSDFGKALLTKDAMPNAFRILHKDGSVHFFDGLGKNLLDNPAVAGFIINIRDVTERKRMEEALRETEERYRSLFDRSLEAIYISDLEGNFRDANPYAMKLLGYEREDIPSLNFSSLLAEEAIGNMYETIGEILRTGSQKESVEYKLRRKDGTYAWVENDAFLLYKDGIPVGIQGVGRDITERKKIEEALRNSEEKLRVMFDSMMDGIVVSDPNINIVDINRAAVEMIGNGTKKELVGRSVMDIIRFKDQEAAMANLARMFKEGRPQEKVEYSIILPGDREAEVEVSTAMMHDNAGNLVGFVNAIRDITERKKAEEALRKSEEKYRNLVERERDVIVSVDALGFVKSVNSAVEMWGYTADEVLKMNFLELIVPEWREVTATQLQSRLLETGEYVGETMVARKDGEQRPIEYSAVVIQEGGKYAGAQAIVRDISERKKSEEALQAKERYFRAITDLSSGAALVVSPDGNIADVTGGLERISGHTREGTLGRSALEFIHPDDLEKSGAAFNEVLRNPGKTVTFEARLKNAQGKWQWTESMITNLLDHHDVRGIVNHLVDVTARKKTEEDIKRHVSRVEALYGVAQVISQSPTLDTMFKDTLGKVCTAMETESGCILMLDFDEHALKLKACKGVPENTMQQFATIDLTDQGIENILNLTGPITEVDETQEMAEIGKIREVVADIGSKGIAVAPFFSGKDLQGLIVIFTTKDRTFSSEDLDLLKAISNEISIGINNMMLLEKTRKMSVTDELTGLYNRRYFFEMLDVEINRAGRTKNPFSLVMLDLDGFKEYNDKYGHSNGDAVLETFSRILKSSIRKSDMAFRYGGDEFALILPSADAEKAKKIVQRARAKWQKATLAQSRVFGGHVGFSTGIAEYPENAESADGLIFLADAALYQAKKNGYEDKIVSELRTLSTDIMDVATQDQVYALAATVDARDPYTYGHSQRVAEIAMLIGKAVGLSSEDLDKLQAAALLHDIGKVGVPDAILTKMGNPTPEEWDVIKKHCSEGARIVSYVKELASLVPIILHHHEWYDGSGYPGGLKGMDIPSGARITTVADSYDTMVTKRPYREVISPSEACEELKRKAGTQFDPIIVDVWCKFVDRERKKGK
jgi:diguanylate cyclase (GGDEF)-like protein/PAS domain S-box-containing protein/putative nucleotidyltransferase with HDIG domain